MLKSCSRRRKPKNLAIMTEIAGTVRIDDTKKNRHVVVDGMDENGDAR